jgi:hypothetical protein
VREGGRESERWIVIWRDRERDGVERERERDKEGDKVLK